MKKKETKGTQGNKLRKQAESRLRDQTDRIDELSALDIKSLAHELATYQVELEMQNDELRRAQVDLEEARSRYVELYDFAPVGYLTLDESLVVVEANLTAAMTLGISKRALAGTPLISRVAPEDRARFLEYCQVVFESNLMEIIEIKMLARTSVFDAELRTTWAESASGEKFLHSTFTDVTERKQLQAEIVKSRDELEDRVEQRTTMLKTSDRQLRYLSQRLLLTQEEERKRLALELHDSVHQSLIAISMLVQNAMNHLTHKQNDKLAADLEDIMPIIKQSIEEVRRIQTDLRPPMLDDLGILATLAWYLREFQAKSAPIQVVQEFDFREEDIPNDLKPVIFRVFQEAMNNIKKHAQADTISVSLKNLEGSIKLSVSDNGLGFDLEETLVTSKAAGRLGLTSMQERTKFSGGTFFIQSEAGHGTTVTAAWPL